MNLPSSSISVNAADFPTLFLMEAYTDAHLWTLTYVFFCLLLWCDSRGIWKTCFLGRQLILNVISELLSILGCNIFQKTGCLTLQCWTRSLAFLRRHINIMSSIVKKWQDANCFPETKAASSKWVSNGRVLQAACLPGCSSSKDDCLPFF